MSPADVCDARLMGADAVLLIVAALSQVMGSALVRRLPDGGGVEATAGFVGELRAALDRRYSAEPASALVQHQLTDAVPEIFALAP